MNDEIRIWMKDDAFSGYPLMRFVLGEFHGKPYARHLSWGDTSYFDSIPGDHRWNNINGGKSEYVSFFEIQANIFLPGYLLKETVIDMIGEMIGELTGKIAGQRIIRHHHTTDVKLERTLDSKGKILGTDVTFIATIRMREREQGGMYAEGDGIMMTAKGEKVILHGSGISVAMKGAGSSMRGIRYAQTKAPSLSRLNNAAFVFEMEIMPDGTYHDKWWEWK